VSCHALASLADPAPLDSGRSIAASVRQSISSHGFPTADVDAGGFAMILKRRAFFEAHQRGRHVIVGVALAVAATSAVFADSADKTDGVRVKLPDPLKGTPLMAPEKTGQDADKILAKMLKPRTDSWADWNAPLEPLHRCGEPRALPPCVPPPPCHPSLPPSPYDLVGVRGTPSCGPIYGGPCEPRTGTHDNGPYPRIHRIHDRMFDWFYTPRTPILP
jgi:hypothetical protein